MKKATKMFATLRFNGNKHIFENDIKYILGANLKHIRINLSKYKDIIELRNAFTQYKTLRNYDIDLLLDLPFPKQKIRLFTQSDKILDAVKGSHINCSIGEFKSDCDICIGATTSNKIFREGEILHYSDGQGDFMVKNIINDITLELIPLNNFQIWSRKSLSLLENNRESDIINLFKEMIVSLKPEYIAFSFLESYHEIIEFIDDISPVNAKLVAKIETFDGMKNVIELSKDIDIFMLGRGDLALFIKQFEFLPLYQALMVSKLREINKELIIATGILDSLRYNTIPTRAELSDIWMLLSQEPEYIVFSTGLLQNGRIMHAAEIINKMQYIYSNCAKYTIEGNID